MAFESGFHSNSRRLWTGVVDYVRQSADQSDFKSTKISYWHNPYEYAWPIFEEYIYRYARPTVDVLVLGMNPGPHGMYQTCIPFGDPIFVRDFLKLQSEVDFEIVRTMTLHKRRPIIGLQHNHKREVSGQRVWEWASRISNNDADVFFARHFILNYCPLLLLDKQGKNVTPEALPKTREVSTPAAKHGNSAKMRLSAGKYSAREVIEEACDESLVTALLALRPAIVIGVGGYAHLRLEHVVDKAKNSDSGEPLWTDLLIGKVLHPSPASPAAQRLGSEGWSRVINEEISRLHLRNEKVDLHGL